MKTLPTAAAIIWLTAFTTSTFAAGSPGKSPVLEAPKPLPTRGNVGRLIPDLEFAPLSGSQFHLRDLKNSRATVIAFTSTSCPVTKRYAPTLAALEREYASRGVKFIFVNPIASDSAADIAEAIKTHQFAGPYVHDSREAIAAALTAKSTAEVFVLDAARTLVYRGAVDDQYGLGYSHDAPKQRYLAAVLDDVLAGKPPSFIATSAPGCALEVADKSAIGVPLTYHARISRIVQQHCTECHHAGGVAPFSLETYAEVSSHAGMMSKVVQRGVMPPWFAAHAADEVSPWANDRTLPAADKADLLAWIAGGKKEGDRADALLPRTYPKDWEIGTPDAIFQIPQPIAVKATGKMPYQNIYVETKFTQDRWVRAIEVLPTARDVVHHVLVFVVPPDKMQSGQRSRRGDGGAGDFFAVYVPGNNVLQFPDGFAKLIPAGAGLHFQIHYTPKGTTTQDQTRIGLQFTTSPPKHEVRVAAISSRLRIPPGEANYQADGFVPVPFDAKILSFMPHMHVRGKAYRYEIDVPGGGKRTLLDVPNYDFNWQLQYRLSEAVDAPAGSRLLGTAWYDNSTNNPANPDPTREVRWGEQTDDEMMLGYFEYYVPSLVPDGKPLSLAEIALRDGGAQKLLRDGTGFFMTLDKNRDGKITPDESPSKEGFRQADTDGNGEVTLDEFKVFWQKRTANAASQR